jgi:hypothetical protein
MANLNVKALGTVEDEIELKKLRKLLHAGLTLDQNAVQRIGCE